MSRKPRTDWLFAFVMVQGMRNAAVDQCEEDITKI